MNPKEIKVKLTQIKYGCSDEIEEFIIQPEIDFLENDIFEMVFKFTHKNKQYSIFLSSVKAKPTPSELECVMGVLKKD